MATNVGKEPCTLKYLDPIHPVEAVCSQAYGLHCRRLYSRERETGRARMRNVFVWLTTGEAAESDCPCLPRSWSGWAGKRLVAGGSIGEAMTGAPLRILWARHVRAAFTPRQRHLAQTRAQHWRVRRHWTYAAAQTAVGLGTWTRRRLTHCSPLRHNYCLRKHRADRAHLIFPASPVQRLPRAPSHHVTAWLLIPRLYSTL